MVLIHHITSTVSVPFCFLYCLSIAVLWRNHRKQRKGWKMFSAVPHSPNKQREREICCVLCSAQRCHLISGGVKCSKRKSRWCGCRAYCKVTAALKHIKADIGPCRLVNLCLLAMISCKGMTTIAHSLRFQSLSLLQLLSLLDLIIFLSK